LLVLFREIWFGRENGRMGKCQCLPISAALAVVLCAMGCSATEPPAESVPTLEPIGGAGGKHGKQDAPDPTETGGVAGSPVGGAAGSAVGGDSSGGAPPMGGAPGVGGDGGFGGEGAGTWTGNPLDVSRQKCVDRINEYRASIGVGPLARWQEAEPCVDGQAASDSQSRIPHGAFGQCGEMAQDECPDWPSVDETVGECLGMMWAEGPGFGEEHGHYMNMSNAQYTSVACGFHVGPSGSVWAVQDFR
jgi:hypothetical protein